ncbi:Flp family type IVb pilin [Novosphingobium sp.]|uniref:Flp family type IVb pilin n=1 Tax=Novosphingobium sp. TaxID=1874826 RepID=UPI00333E72F8
MSRIVAFFSGLRREFGGVATVEYALLIGFITIAMLGALMNLGSMLANTLNFSTNSIASRPNIP